MVELLSIDVSNFCSKQCTFCYNHSRKDGNTVWKVAEIVDFASDCVKNGIKSVSLGGGEPFEYEGIFEVIEALFPVCYLSITTNGLPLENKETWKMLIKHSPDKIHVTIHNPDNEDEVSRVEKLIRRISATKIKPGLNLLVSASKLEFAKNVYSRLSEILTAEQIILVPQRFADTPTSKQLASLTNGKPFQAPSCILGCSRPRDFASVTWDKKVASCSYSPCHVPLKTLDYKGLFDALNAVEWKSCKNDIN